MSTNQNIKSGDNDFFKMFGFVSNEARQNLIVFFLVILLFSNMFFIYQNIALQTKINECNQSKFDTSVKLYEKITAEVRKQIYPTTERIKSAASKIDSIANQTNIILIKSKRFKNNFNN